MRRQAYRYHTGGRRAIERRPVRYLNTGRVGD